MQKLDENYIFDKVRTTLEEYQPECSSSDWSKMSALLDKQTPVTKSKRSRDLLIGFIAGVVVTLSFVGTLYFSQGEKVTHSQRTSATNVAVNNIKLNEQPISFNEKPKNLTTKIERVQIQVASCVADVISIDISSIPEEKVSNNSFNYTKENSNSADVLGLNRDIAENTLFSREITRKKIDLSAYFKVRPEKIIGLNTNKLFAFNRIEKKYYKSKLITINWDIFKGAFQFQDDMYKRFVGPDRVRLGYMPELIFGSFQDKSRIGQGVGVEILGPISKRVFFGLGLNLHSSNWSRAQDFNSMKLHYTLVDSSYYLNTDSIHEWKGKWSYIEIPLSLNLHFMTIGKSKIFLNSSIAAVLMHSEEYEYSRIVDNVKYTLNEKPSPFANNVLLGNLKVGIELRYFINRRWNFYFEPYYKWSLNGLGEKEIRPRSLGINLGLIYQFNLHEN